MNYYSKYLKYKTKYINLKNNNLQNGGQTKILYEPIHIKEFDIYDIFYNDRNQIIIISPAENKPLDILYKEINNYTESTSDNTESISDKEYFKKFHIEICPHSHTYIYICDAEEYNSRINLIINENKIKVDVNKYPNFSGEIIMSTLVKNEDNYIIQWIEYHRKLGIDRFIIYDNKSSTTPINKKNETLLEVSTNLPKILEKYINKGIVVLINWPYQYRLPVSGISGQTTQQNHSIYAFNRCKYIGLFDIDEYLNPQTKEINIDKIFNNIIKKYNLDIRTIGSFMIKCKNFFNPDNLPTNDYEFLKIYTCEKITLKGREKNFVIPSNVKTFSVHQITSGKKTFTVNFNILYFNHYLFLNKKERGKYKTNLIDKTIKRILDIIKLF
jgi:hypothetical protein